MMAKPVSWQGLLYTAGLLCTVHHGTLLPLSITNTNKDSPHEQSPFPSCPTCDRPEKERRPWVWAGSWHSVLPPRFNPLEKPTTKFYPKGGEPPARPPSMFCLHLWV